MSNKKDKKKKNVYIDDGRTIVDMSCIGKSSVSNDNTQMPHGFRDKIRTYFESVKLMLLPMLITLGIVAAAFGILYLLLSLA